jgi:hypothetical protein
LVCFQAQRIGASSLVSHVFTQTKCPPALPFPKLNFLIPTTPHPLNKKIQKNQNWDVFAQTKCPCALPLPLPLPTLNFLIPRTPCPLNKKNSKESKVEGLVG